MNSLDPIFEHPLCLNCLGRGFARLGKGLNNYERGSIIMESLGSEIVCDSSRLNATEKAREEFKTLILDIFTGEAAAGRMPEVVEPEACWLCEGLVGEISEFAVILINDLKSYEFDNLLVGAKVDPELLSREDSFWSSVAAASPESIKVELNREVGKILNEKLKKPTEFEVPEIVGVIDTRFNVSEISPSPIFIYGRYLKLKRGIPQTRWHCKKCRGAGCEHCNGKGKMYETSVEELIAEPAQKMAGATAFALHGMGREDIDVLMLGTGRPFVLELSRPKRRKIELDKLTNEINEKNQNIIQVTGFRESSRKEMISVKMGKYYKTYRCRIESEIPVLDEKLKMVVNSFVEKVISQKTPIRVSHRRADKLRKKTVANIYIKSHIGQQITLDIKAEGGLYIKELIHGDSGRTQPNLSDELNTKCEVKELDVLEVHDSE